MSSGDIMTPTLEETGGLKLSNMRNASLMGAAIPPLDFGTRVLDFVHIHKQGHKCRSNRNSNFQIKNKIKSHHTVISSDPFSSRNNFLSPKLFLSFAWSIFLKRYFKLMPHRLFFPRKLLWEDFFFSSEVLIFQTFLPVFNSTCDQNPSCRIICEKDKHAQKCLQGLRFTRKNCTVVKLKMHNTESCCQKDDTSTMLGVLLPTGDISGGFCFI